MSTALNKLEWPDLWQKDICTKDSGGRWYAKHLVAVEYCSGYRSPSRVWPQSHAKPLLTRKFAKWCAENHPNVAKEWGIL